MVSTCSSVVPATAGRMASAYSGSSSARVWSTLSRSPSANAIPTSADITLLVTDSVSQYVVGVVLQYFSNTVSPSCTTTSARRLFRLLSISSCLATASASAVSSEPGPSASEESSPEQAPTSALASSTATGTSAEGRIWSPPPGVSAKQAAPSAPDLTRESLVSWFGRTR